MPDSWDQANVPEWDLAGHWDDDLWLQWKRKHMSIQLTLNLPGLSDAELVKMVKDHEKGVADNPEVFITPDPPPAALATARGDLEESMATQTAAAATAAETTRVKNEKRTIVENMMRTRDGYVTKLGRTNPSAPGLSNLPLRNPSLPVGLVAAPLALGATLGDLDHTMDLGWDKVHGARSYVIQFCADPMNDAHWLHAGVSTKSSFTVTGLTAGTKYWFRVAAVGASGQGPWSDVTSKMAV